MRIIKNRFTAVQEARDIILPSLCLIADVIDLISLPFTVQYQSGPSLSWEAGTVFILLILRAEGGLRLTAATTRVRGGGTGPARW